MELPLKTILLVEDDATNRKLLRVVLGDNRYRIVEAASAGEALQQLEQVQPDLLLLDIRLGESSGLEVVKAVRADSRYDHMPVVAITAQAMKDDKKRFLAAGFDGYLSKPVDTRLLPEIVQRFIDEGRKVPHV